MEDKFSFKEFAAVAAVALGFCTICVEGSIVITLAGVGLILGGGIWLMNQEEE